MEALFAYQLVGDLLRVTALVVSYVFLSKAFIATVISFEVLFAAMLWLLANALTREFGIAGLVITHTIIYGLYLLICTLWYLVVIRPSLKKNFHR